MKDSGEMLTSQFRATTIVVMLVTAFGLVLGSTYACDAVLGEGGPAKILGRLECSNDCHVLILATECERGCV